MPPAATNHIPLRKSQQMFLPRGQQHFGATKNHCLAINRPSWGKQSASFQNTKLSPKNAFETVRPQTQGGDYLNSTMQSSVRKRAGRGRNTSDSFGEDLVNEGSFDSLNEIKIDGMSQFKKECLETETIIDRDGRLCHMNKLHENTDTNEYETEAQMQELVIAEHCSPRLLV